MKKDKLLKKIVKQNLNNHLEKVLSKKGFSEEIKNVLLNMFYKIETGYNDYFIIKREAFNKNEYIEKLINIIDKNCDKIEFPDKDSKEPENKDKRSIICFPVDNKILEELSKTEKKDIIMEDLDENICIAFSEFLNIGNTMNMVEPLRDFSGFSWNVIIKDIKDLDYNLMYQNINFLVGNEFLDKWVNNYDSLVDYFELFKERIEEQYGSKVKEQIITYLMKLSIWKKAISDRKYKNSITNRKEDLEDEYYELENREIYLAKVSKLKKKKEKKIKDLDKILSDKKLIQNEYDKRNENLPLEKKIFSIRVLKEQLKDERLDLLKEINEYNKMMTPSAFLKRKHDIEENLKYIDMYEDIDLKEEITNTIIELQKEIINCMYKEIQKAKEKEEMINEFYKCRYYNLLPINEKQSIYEIEELHEKLGQLIKCITNKAIDMKVIIKITNDSNVNEEIINKILLSKIVRLEDINVKILSDKTGIYLMIYDEDTEESKIKLENVTKENIKIKINKKMNLFI